MTTVAALSSLLMHRLIRRSFGVLAVLATATAVGFVAAGPAAGASRLDYPPTPCAAVSVSTTVPVQGSEITIHGTGFTPNVTVELTVQSTGELLASVKSNASGQFTTVVRLPDNLTGQQHIVATGGQGATCSTPSILITVRPQPTASHTPGGSGGPPATTGFDVLAYVVLGALLIGVGGVLTSVRRRRRPVVPDVRR
jgi:hypothetical protein